MQGVLSTPALQSLHSRQSYIHVRERYSQTQIKETVSNETTSRLVMAEYYQDNSIETPLKQEQNSGHFLAKPITDCYYFFLNKHFIKLVSWEPDIPVWCAKSNRLTWDYLTPPGTTGFPIFQLLWKLLLTDTHLLVIRFWFLFFHICIIFFERIIINIWKPE